MAHSYSNKTNSPDKWAARKAMYDNLTPTQKLGYHVVIVGWVKGVGFTCDDIPYLISQGIKANKIIACGFGKEYVKEFAYLQMNARDWAHRKYGVIASGVEDVVETVSWAQENGLKLGSVNVDLCTSLITSIWVAKAALAKVNNACPVFYTYCRRKDGLKYRYAKESDTSEFKDMRRKEYINTQLNRLPKTEDRFYYRSVVRDNNGKVVKDGSNMCATIFRKQYKCGKCKLMGEHPSQHQKHCLINNNKG